MGMLLMMYIYIYIFEAGVDVYDVLLPLDGDRNTSDLVSFED